MPTKGNTLAWVALGRNRRTTARSAVSPAVESPRRKTLPLSEDTTSAISAEVGPVDVTPGMNSWPTRWAGLIRAYAAAASAFGVVPATRGLAEVAEAANELPPRQTSTTAVVMAVPRRRSGR